MDRRVWIGLVVASLVRGLGLEAQEPEPAAGDAAAVEQQMLAAFVKLRSPGVHHRHLDHMVGTWETKGKLWPIAGGPQLDFTGATRSEWILAGRFVESSFTGELGGEPFAGKGLDGYDNVGRLYVGTWVDSSGTGIVHFEGRCEEDGKVRTMLSSFQDAQTGQPIFIKGVTTVVDADSYKHESFRVIDGEPTKILELHYTRVP